MSSTEIKIGGFGGQGVIMSGIIIGKAAALFGNRNATLIQSFGPEARGSACSAQVIVSDEPILYPYVTKPGIMVVMSQEACDRFLPELDPNGTLLVEEDLVKLSDIPPTLTVHARAMLPLRAGFLIVPFKGEPPPELALSFDGDTVRLSVSGLARQVSFEEAMQ